MAIPLKQSTASQEVPLGYFVDDTDGKTAETGLTIANTDIKLWKMGATSLANKNSGGATHISGGIYYCVLDATDTATLGGLVIFVHVAGALPVRVECIVYPAVQYDTMIAGTDTYDVNVTTIAANAVSASALATDAVTEMQSGLATSAALAMVDGNVDDILTDTGTTIPASIAALNDISTAEVNAEVVDALNVDTYAEPSSVPAATASLVAKIGWLTTLARNKITQTATTQTLYADDGTTEVGESTVSDDGSTATTGEWS